MGLLMSGAMAVLKTTSGIDALVALAPVAVGGAA